MTQYVIVISKGRERQRRKYQSYTEAWLAMERFKALGYRILEAPEPVEFPSFPLEAA